MTPTSSRIQDTDESTIDGYVNMLIDEGVSANSRDVYIRTLRRFYSYLEKETVIFNNPTLDIVSHTDNRLKSVPSESEMFMLLKEPNVSTTLGIRNRAILETAYSAGLRMNELINIKIFDIDLINGLLLINGKGNKERTVPLGKQAIFWIDEYLKKSRDKLLKDNIDEHALWIGKLHNAINAVIINSMIRKYARQSGMKTHITVHSIRRACATHMLSNGAHPSQIQLLLGHSTMKHLRQYLRISDSEIKKMHSKSKVGK